MTMYLWQRLLQQLELMWPKPAKGQALAGLGDDAAVVQSIYLLQHHGLVRARVVFKSGRPCVQSAHITTKGRSLIGQGERLVALVGVGALGTSPPSPASTVQGVIRAPPLDRA
jgi:hypothetical protein